MYINEQGHVYNRRTGHISTAHSYGAVAVHSYSVCGIDKSFQVSRAVAYNFVPIPRELYKVPKNMLEVRHIDGNKRNCCASNLQWVASSKYHPIIVMDNEGVEHKFYSITEAWCRFGKSSYRAFCFAVKKGFLKSQGITFKKVTQ